jgi:CheY-like chemotaxis protein
MAGADSGHPASVGRSAYCTLSNSREISSVNDGDLPDNTVPRLAELIRRAQENMRRSQFLRTSAERLRAEAAQRRTTDRRTTDRRMTERPTPDRRTVLVVDDEPAVRLVVSRILSDAGYRVITAMSGEDALRTARTSGPVHVLVTDLRMPIMNGVELATHIRDIHPDTRVLVMAGYPTHDTVGYRVLIKPFAMGELESEVGRLFGEAPAE